MPLSEATWEDLAYIKSEFPDFNLEDKVSINRGSIDGIQATQEEKVEGTIVEQLEYADVGASSTASGRPKRIIKVPAKFNE